MPECLIAYIFRNSERLNQVTRRLCFDCYTGRRDTPDLVVFRTPYTGIDIPHVMLALCPSNLKFGLSMTAMLAYTVRKTRISPSAQRRFWEARWLNGMTQVDAVPLRLDLPAIL